MIARGTDWEMKLHLFMAKGPKPENEPAPFSDTYPTGSLVFLKPLLGNTNLRKVRKIGSRMVPLGDIMPLKGPASDGRYSVLKLYSYKSTNTDAAARPRASSEAAK